MNNATDTLQAIYLEYKRSLTDLKRLGRDFDEAISERLSDFTEQEEYSTGGKYLEVRRCHTWLSRHPLDEDVPQKDRTFHFAACVVYFEADGKRWKLGPPGRPELWFFIGKAVPQPSGNLAWRMETFFEDDQKFFQPRPSLGGTISHYVNKEDGEAWDAVCLAFELGAITSPEDLITKAVEPLVTAARDRDLV